MEILKNPRFDFLGKAKLFVALSIVLVAGGVAWMASRGVAYGVEFSGGTQLIAQFQTTPEIDRIRDAVGEVSPGAVIQTYGDSRSHKVLIRIAGETGEGELDTVAREVLRSLAERYPANPVTESSSEIVGPIVGAELRRKAVILTVLGLLFQLIYIAARFKGGVWGVAASVAALHDVLVCLGFLGVLGYEITLNVIAALLTLVGYSVNDTIVIFDRVRENLRQRRKEPIGTVINDSLNQTLTRTLISNGTTFLAVLGLYLFGGEVLRGFGFTMVVGILVGTYSTIYIAAPLVVWWSEFSRRRQAPASARAAL
ncbi:MAG TPA: protein translocase subunit SecF [Vicinamibacteria bacterium]|nr:protein translocase subunit SecF [Vicinamibacteria bacterium]